MKTIYRILFAAIIAFASLNAQGRTYLVSVGVGDYSKYPGKAADLKLTVADAKAIVDLYSANTAVDYSLLINEKATKERIIKAIKKVFKMAGENDIVVFFFSGHGYPGGFCAYDGNLSYSDVRQAMAESKSKNKMMFVDACRSGGMRVNTGNSQGDVESAKKANVMLFLAARNDEDSYERSESMSNGIFTTYLQKALKGGADANRDRKITAKELFTFVYDGVLRTTGKKQHPVMWGNFSDNMVVMQW